MHQSTLVPILETDRLLLRGHHADDFQDSAAMWADEEVVARISGIPSTSEQTWARLLRYSGHWYHLGFGYWVVESKADGSFIGEVGFGNFRRDTEPSLAGTPEAGWVLNRRSHGKGYATEAVTAMLAWADENLDCSHTAAMFDPTHAASLNVAKKVGYSNEVIGRYGNKEVLFLKRKRRSSDS